MIKFEIPVGNPWPRLEFCKNSLNSMAIPGKLQTQLIA